MKLFSLKKHATVVVTHSQPCWRRKWFEKLGKAFKRPLSLVTKGLRNTSAVVFTSKQEKGKRTAAFGNTCILPEQSSAEAIYTQLSITELQRKREIRKTSSSMTGEEKTRGWKMLCCAWPQKQLRISWKVMLPSFCRGGWLASAHHSAKEKYLA